MSANSENEENRQLARVLSTLIWASWGTYLFVILTSLYYNDWRLIAVTLAGCALLIVPLVLLRRRRLRASSLVVMLIELGTVTIIATVGQGIRDLAIVAFPIIFIFAGLALDRTFFGLCVGLTLVAVCWLVFGEAFGWFTTQPFNGEMTIWFYLIGVTIILLVAALAVDLLATNMRRNLERARTEVAQRKRVEEEILQLNVNLEQRVSDRTRELREAQEQLVRQEKLAVLGQMAGSVGHELRNPLGIINNALYFLRLVQPDADQTVKEYLGIIQTETHNADKIISDLLDFSRIKSVDVEPVAVSDLVRRTLERFPAPEEVRVTFKLPENLPLIYVDPRQMMQVLGNLVLNACQAMVSTPSGGQANSTTDVSKGGKLTLSAKKKGKMVAVAVADTGAGITPENIKKLFEPLFTTKPKGIGLGLAVSKKLVEANGGRIEVESEAGLGSTFTLYLPARGG